MVGRIHERAVRPNSRRLRNEVGLGGRIRVNLSGASSGPVETVKGANMSFHRRALAAVGGFDPGYGGTAFLEDADISLRLQAAGFQIWFEAGAALTHFSAPSGGVRANPEEAEWWRFHNTGRLVGRHRGRLGAATMTMVFSAIAVKRAIYWRHPRAFPRLLDALHQGYMSE